MPELPEVETVRQNLEQYILGAKIAELHVLQSKSWAGDQVLILGQRIVSLSRRSKILFLHFENGLTIATHLKMSGQLIYVRGSVRTGGGHPTADWTAQLPSSHTRLVFTFSDGGQLFFNDQRMFGWMRLVDADGLAAHVANLGPDITDADATAERFFLMTRRRRVPVKVCVMDNAILAGVGNIYACDGLHLAKISPFRPVGDLTREEVERLVTALKSVIALGIQYGGATIDGAYVNVAGFAGQYQNVMRVYGKAGQPCQECGTLIQRRTLAGRGTFFCPTCQQVEDV